MIKSFRDKESAKVFQGDFSKRLPFEIQERALRKLIMLNQAQTIADLSSVPGNHFELLSGDRNGQFSIRINQQWRICFQFSEPNAFNVEIVDYH